MLVELTIENVALVQQARLGFTHGLTVVTGETGSGKSILLDALALALGARADVELIRHGAQRARVEAVFHIPTTHPSFSHWVDAGDIDPDDPVVALMREVDRNGRGGARCNGRTVPVAILREWAARLIDVHGQHEHQSLLDEAQHIEWLDQWIGESAARHRTEVARCWTQWRDTLKELEQLQTNTRERSREIEMLEFQLREIESARLVAGEDDTLRVERERLEHAERLSQSSDAAYRSLDLATQQLGKAVAELQRVQEYDPAIEPLLASANEALYSAEDGSRGCRQYRDSVEFNPQRLGEIDDRLDIIRNLTRKYGENIEAILQFSTDGAQRLERLRNTEENQDLLAKRAEQERQQLKSTCKALSELRRHHAPALENAVRGALAELAMGAALFEVAFEGAEPGPGGTDKVAFRLSTNPGVPPRALAKIASGGEISRVMLALKSVFSQSFGFSSLVFDEVDAGIGGRTGIAIARKLQSLARETQVFCVTHLPQVASAADQHFRIEKHLGPEQTTLTIEPLDDLSRVDEIARMLGDSDSATARNHAKEMLRLESRRPVGIQPSVA